MKVIDLISMTPFLIDEDNKMEYDIGNRKTAVRRLVAKKGTKIRRLVYMR